MAKIKIQDILVDLQKLAEEKSEKVYKTKSPYLGIPISRLRDYAKQLGRDHDLAQKLWLEQLRDAKILATLIEEPPKVKEEQIDRWVNEIDYWDLGDCLSVNIIARTPFAYTKMHDYVYSRNAWTRRAGFVLLEEVAKNGVGLESSEFEEFLDLIEEKIQVEDNWVKEAMNSALIAIGSRNIELNEQALEVVKKIGKVVVDYGDTSCQTPDAYTKLTSSRLVTRLS